jgi:diadenosine tetraphosphate (Ap4A) HIT family hydrolase
MSQQEENKISAYVSPDLEYCYRDISNIFVGSNEVTFEFGNHHKSAPGHAVVNNRIVMSLANAYDLQQRLQQALMQAQQAIMKQE